MGAFEWTPGPGVGARAPRTTASYDPLQRRGVTDRDVQDAWKRYEMALSWKPPAGHASWCDKQLPPVWGRRHVGDTPMAHKGACTCGKSSLSRSLRSLEDRQAVRV